MNATMNKLRGLGISIYKISECSLLFYKGFETDKKIKYVESEKKKKQVYKKAGG